MPLLTSLPADFCNGSEDDERHHIECFHSLYLSFTIVLLTLYILRRKSKVLYVLLSRVLQKKFCVPQYLTLWHLLRTSMGVPVILAGPALARSEDCFEGYTWNPTYSLEGCGVCLRGPPFSSFERWSYQKLYLELLGGKVQAVEKMQVAQGMRVRKDTVSLRA